MKTPLLLLVFIALSVAQGAGAVQSMFGYMVNNETKQCALVGGGDECSTIEYSIPVGWEPAPASTSDNFGGCPAGYQQIELPYKVKPHWQAGCLFPGHSGSSYTFNYFWFGVVPLALVLSLGGLWLLRRLTHRST